MSSSDSSFYIYVPSPDEVRNKCSVILNEIHKNMLHETRKETARKKQLYADFIAKYKKNRYLVYKFTVKYLLQQL